MSSELTRQEIRRAAGTDVDPETPSAVTGKYLPALDGLRGVAMIAIFAYHMELGKNLGTYLAVDLFFVLSGFLITSLLLEERVRTGHINLPQFWARRARRLLPALLVVLAAIGVFVVLLGRFGGPGAAAQIDLSGLRGDALATLFYVANWHFIWAHTSYFGQFQTQSPLLHTWTLAIEEQFYLIWPPLLVLLLRRLRRRWRDRVLTVAVVGSIVSALVMALLYSPGADPSRVYFGTDTRAMDMLAGAAVAALVAARPQPSAVNRRRLHVIGSVAAVVLAVFWVVAGSGGGDVTGAGAPAGWMFQGGFLVCAALAALVIADVRQLEPGLLGRALSFRPLRWVGTISYGLYLWHWPVIVYLSPARTGIAGPALDLLRVAVAVGLAAASFYLIERPIRQRRFRGALRFSLAPLCVVVTAVVIVVTTLPSVVTPAQAAQPTAVATGGVGGQAPGSGGYQGQQPVALRTTQPISPSHPLRVLLLGDSLMETSELAIARALEATGEVVVTQQGFPGWGLSTDPGWPTQFPKLVAQYRPDIIIAMWSWDNALARAEPETYRAELGRAIDELTAKPDGASGFFVLQTPPIGPGLADVPPNTPATVASDIAGQQAFDRLARSLTDTMAGKVLYLPVAKAVELNDRYSTWLPPLGDHTAAPADWVRVRMVDNVHFCPAGAVRYGAAVLADLQEMYHLRGARSGWWKGSWASDARYNTPVGTCPVDHPPG